MGEIHELIAVQENVKNLCMKMIAEGKATFQKKTHLFLTHSKMYEPLKEGDIDKPEEEPAMPISTVMEKVKYVEGHVIRLIDLVVQKEDANAMAKEDIVVEEGNVLAKDVPVAALVQLENLLSTVRANIYSAIPTLDPAKRWFSDKTEGEGYYVTRPIQKQRTKKVQKPLTLHKESEKHPAQVHLITEDVPVGTWSIMYYSGMISPAEKSILLERLEKLIEAVKKARTRANKTKVKNLLIGKRLFKYLDTGK